MVFPSITAPAARNLETTTASCFREAADLESNDYVLNAPGEGESIWNKGEFVLYDYWGKQSGYINVYQDVTYEREQSRRIKKMAVRDPLTGLANRAGMYEYFDTIDKSKRVSFMAPHPLKPSCTKGRILLGTRPA